MHRENILVSSSRSGTNFFLEVLGKCDPNAVILREIFRRGSDRPTTISHLTQMPEAEVVRLAREDPVSLWRTICNRCKADDRQVIAKIFYYHAPERSPIWGDLRENANVVHLVRRNLFRTFVSLKMAETTGVWHLRSDEVARVEPIHIVASEAEDFIRARTKRIEWARRFFAGARYSEVHFEDISSSPEECARVIAGLGLAERPSTSDLTLGIQRQSPDDLSLSVRNYAEVRHLDRDQAGGVTCR